LAVMIRGKLTPGEWLSYTAAQLGAGTAGGLAARGILGPGHPGTTANTWKVLLVELLFTFALAYVVLNVATARASEGNSYFGLAIGFTVTAGAFAVGGISGGAFNPAVALGVSILGTFAWNQLWIYLTASLAGAAIAAGAFRYVQPSERPGRTWHQPAPTTSITHQSEGRTRMSAKPPDATAAVTGPEAGQVERANASGRTPVMFVHGLWLLPSSWDRWAEVFEAAGYVTLTPGWPDDPETTMQAHEHPEVFAGKSIGQVADHYAAIAGSLDRKPVIIGHSFGGLLAQILAGRGPISSLRSASPALGNPANRHRAVPLTYDQFRYAFANAVSEEEARQLYETYAVPAPGLPLFQAAAANFNPWTEAKADTENPGRGPLLIISGEKDHTVPWAIANASYKHQARNEGVTEITEMPGRGHALTIDSGWREVADTALAFVQRFTPSPPAK